MTGVALAFVRLRWRLLFGAIRHGGTEQVGAVVSTVASALIGIGVGVAVLISGRTNDHADDVAVIFCAVVVLATLGFGVVAGISQPIDPRVLAAEPLPDPTRALGFLAASAFGPPGLAGIAIGIGLVAGMTRDLASLPLVAAAGVAWLLTLLLLARTATNALGVLLARSPRSGQLAVGAFGLVFYGAFQFVPAFLGGLEPDQRTDIADVLAWTPPGQLGRAMGAASTSPGAAVLHLVAGALWLPVLVIVFVRSARRLAMTTRRGGGLDTGNFEHSAFGRGVRRSCGTGIASAIAWRSILTRFRTPRTALEAFTGAGVGLAAVLVPTLTRDTVGSGAVLVGGAVQLAVLFMSGNSFGSDGPAVTHELLAGADLRQLIAGKARSIAIVASPLAIIGPTLAASITGEWRFFVAGLGVGLGSLLAGTGAAIVQSALVPISMPESDNPFASGESGKGVIAALLLLVVLGALAIATIPIAVALIWATDRDDTALVTVLGLATIAIGWLVARLGVVVATRRLGGREPEFIASVTPAR